MKIEVKLIIFTETSGEERYCFSCGVENAMKGRELHLKLERDMKFPDMFPNKCFKCGRKFPVHEIPLYV